MKKIAFILLMLLPAFVLKAQWATSGSNIYYNGGNVGIGTGTIAMPSTLLEVKSPIDAFSTGTQFLAPINIGWTNDYGSGGAAQWLLLTPYLSSAGGSPAAGLNGTLTFYRGSTSSGNINADYHVNIQAAYNATVANVVPLSAQSPVLALHVVTYSGKTFIAIDPADLSGSHSSGNFSYYGYYWNNYASPQNIKPTLILQSSATDNSSLIQNYQSVASNAMYVNTAGNVGIGTTSPGSYKLAVEGNIGARKVVVTQAAPWPDYVFDSAYNLRPLSFVNNYIKANRHLPGILSASEVIANGLDVGDTQADLLRKIEELTLYAIEQDKLQKNTEAQLAAQNKTIAAQQELLQQLRKDIDNLKTVKK